MTITIPRWLLIYMAAFFFITGYPDVRWGTTELWYDITGNQPPMYEEYGDE